MPMVGGYGSKIVKICRRLKGMFPKSKKGKWKHVVGIVIVFVTYMTISRWKKFNYFAKKQIFAILQANQKIFGPNIRLFL